MCKCIYYSLSLPFYFWVEAAKCARHFRVNMPQPELTIYSLLAPLKFSLIWRANREQKTSLLLLPTFSFEQGLLCSHFLSYMRFGCSPFSWDRRCACGSCHYLSIYYKSVYLSTYETWEHNQLLKNSGVILRTCLSQFLLIHTTSTSSTPSPPNLTSCPTDFIHRPATEMVEKLPLLDVQILVHERTDQCYVVMIS